MILFNKLIRVDISLLLAVLLLLVVHMDFWRGFLQGFAVALVFLSLVNHVEHWKRTKKFY